MVLFTCKLKFFSLVFQSFFTLWYICFLSFRCFLYFSGKEARTGSKCLKILVNRERQAKKIRMMWNYLGASFFSNYENQMAEPIHLIWEYENMPNGRKQVLCQYLYRLSPLIAQSKKFDDSTINKSI